MILLEPDNIALVLFTFLKFCTRKIVPNIGAKHFLETKVLEELVTSKQEIFTTGIHSNLCYDEGEDIRYVDLDVLGDRI